MKKLKTDIDGGMPIVLDDIRFMYESFVDVVNAFGSFFEQTGALATVLSGFETSVSGSPLVITITPAWMVYNGEVYYFEGYTGPFEPLNLRFVEKKVYLPDGNKNFLLSGPHDTYEVRSLKIIHASPTYLFTVADLNLASESVYEKMKVWRSEMTQIESKTVLAPSPYVGTWRIDAKKGFGGVIHLQGLGHTTGIPGAGFPLTTLPTDLHPSENLIFICESSSVYGNVPARVMIMSTGEVILVGFTDGNTPSEALISLNLSYYRTSWL